MCYRHGVESLVSRLVCRRAKPLDVKKASRAFLGGRGLGTYLLWALGGHAADPLSGENPLVFASGSLTGTGVPMSGRAAAVFSSPLTGITGASNTGGRPGSAIRYGGVDVLVVVGKAEKHAYLVVHEGGVEFKDARG